MKKNKVIALVSLLTLVANLGFGQNSNVIKRMQHNRKERTTLLQNTPYDKNVIQVNPLRLCFGTINLSYERILSPSMSLNSRIKYNSLRFAEKWFDDFMYVGEDFQIGLSEHPQFKHFGIDFELRYYVGAKKPASGFYCGPYLRYLNYSGKFNSTYQGTLGDFETSVNGSLKNALNIYGIGFQTGAKVRMKNHFSFDWSIAGVGVDLYRYGIQLESDNINQAIDEYSIRLQNAFGSYSTTIARKLLISEVDNQLSAKKWFALPGWRSSFTIGYSF